MTKKIVQFIEDYKNLCRKYQLCLSHEDGHGAFIIEPLDENLLKWVEAAQIGHYVEKEND